MPSRRIFALAWLLALALLGASASAAPTDLGWDLYVPIRTYHMPYAYSPALRRTYNDFPLGGGLGLGRFDGRGNYLGVFAMEFADSHSRPQYNAGLAWVPTWEPFGDGLRFGAGVTGLVIARSDIRRYTPFPVALPLGSVGFGHLDLQATFIPGFKGDGNVLFSWVKLSF